jgi:hypothetical protein
VKSVRVFPFANGPEQEYLPAAVNLRSPVPLLLEFDDLFGEYERYYVKFIHCNSDWTPSSLFALDYLDAYNEFPIEEYNFSFNTRVPYIHYSFLIPRFKVPGNYLLVVYKESESNLVLTHRFMVFEQRLTMEENLEMAGLSRIGRMTQEIQFTLNYNGSDLANPARNVQATIRQNQRWDNAIYNLKPTNVWETNKKIEYKHFALENQFRGGNQFRFFDLRSLEYFGRNVETVNLKPEIRVATLMIDRARVGAYSGYEDCNGKSSVVDPVNAEYAYTEFFIETEQIDGQVFLGGSFDNWNLDSPMTYISSRQGYYTNRLLKEGVYDYQYVVQAPDLTQNYFEGDHFQTENEYEILIYYYSFELNADLLLGYFPISRNARNR